MTIRLRRSALAALSLTAASVVTPGQTSVPVVPALAGTTTVVGSASAVMKVKLPVAADLAADAVIITGSGRFGGAVLRRLGSAPEDGPIVYMIRYNRCFSPACPPRIPRDFFYAQGAGSHPSFSQAHLAAGDYQLYLFADQAPITVAFSLTGLAGSATLAPTVHLPIEVVTPAPAIPRTDPLTPYYSSGVRRTFSGAGAGALMALGFDASVPGHVETIYGTCAFREEPLPRSIMGPGCPKRGLGGPSGNVIEDGTITADRYQGYAFAAFVAAPGPWTLGQYFINAGPTTKADSFFALFDFDDAYTP